MNYISFEDYANWIKNILDADCVEGPQGLYFRVAETTAKLTGAEYGVVVVPAAKETLRVVGAWGGLPKQLEEFSIDRGIIGRLYREALEAKKKYEIVDDVSNDNDYYQYHELTKSELVVPVFDAAREQIESVINVESHCLGHFREVHANILSNIGDIMVQCLTRLQQIEQLKKYNQGLIEILENIPDELMVIDTNYRPVYADLIKMMNLPRLQKFFKQSPLEALKEFLLSSTPCKYDSQKACHSIIELRSTRCQLCICYVAMKKKEVVGGVIYKPENMNDIFELSAAPIYSNNDNKKTLIGCVETARYITKREKVLECPSELFARVSENEVLRSAVEFLQKYMNYARVRVYSADSYSNKLRGITCSTGHGITPEEFSKFEFEIPNFLEKVLTIKKAGLVSTDPGTTSEDALGYWQISVTPNRLKQSIDPEGSLGLEGVEEIAVVPVIAKMKRWIICIDSKEERISADKVLNQQNAEVMDNRNERTKFTLDDLQALTVFARFSSLAMELVGKNEWIFKAAIAGETAEGMLVHLFARFFGESKGEVSGFLVPLRGAMNIATDYLRSKPTEIANQILSEIISRLGKTLESETEIPQAGDINHWCNTVINNVIVDKSDSEERVFLQELARVLPESQENLEFAKKLRKAAQIEPALCKLSAKIVDYVIYLKNQEGLKKEVEAFRIALRELVPKPKSEFVEPKLAEKLFQEKTLCGINWLVRIASHMVRRATEQEIHLDCSPEMNVNVNRGRMFLAFEALLKNAVEASRSAGKEADVQVRTEGDGTDSTISIFNNGDFISEENKSKVFHEPFTTKATGTGLGLSFAYDWIKNSGGKIVFESGQHTGTTFILTFPIA